MRFSFFLLLVTLAAGCIVEDKPLAQPDDGGVDAGELCGAVVCPGDHPLCNDELQCVQCTASEDAYCTERSLVCDVESSTCTECTDDRDCTSPAAARCDDGTCAPCTDNDQCDGVEGLDQTKNACDDEGVCVDCTPETEEDTCPDQTTCHPVNNVCTEVKVGALDVCEECVSDSQCGEDGAASELHRCVPMYYETVDNRFPNDQAGFCLKVFSMGGCEQPYAIETPDRESLSGEPPDTYCGINETLATCPAVRALKQNVDCPQGDDSGCPESGLCRDVGGLSDTCTYRCASIFECLENIPDGTPGSTCGSSGSGNDDYCGG